MARYEWTRGGEAVTDAALAEWTRDNAHRFYEAARGVFVVREEDGYTGDAATESVYREDAFEVAAKHYGVDYDVFYGAWLNEVPVNFNPFPKLDAMLREQ